VGAVSVDDLVRDARPMGAHLLECSGNNNPANFGLMSVAEWDGVPLIEVIAALKPQSNASGVLVSGVDPEQPSRTSISGASWVLPLASLDSLGAFLAVRMNGDVLPLDHGRPVRLAVPGWYGCSWIKWVDEIRLVDASEPATTQMREFAARTHQTAVHDLAGAYAPPVIQTAATAVRVEKRLGASGLEYRIVGIVWGGARTVDRLAIRFSDSEAWVPFDVCPAPGNPAIWSLWSYRWKPAAPGVYSIALKVPDSAVPQRRLESGYYVRQVRIDEV
jgi:DMSO/TMAO reductase YedYZ molybdopterin-dependent catalytic subunit